MNKELMEVLVKAWSALKESRDHFVKIEDHERADRMAKAADAIGVYVDKLMPEKPDE